MAQQAVAQSASTEHAAAQDSDAASTTTERSGKTANANKPSYKHIPHSQKPPHLVAKRNARERRRVQAVNQAFYRLRKSVPIENRNKRVSKVKTLQRAIDYIRKLERVLAEDDATSTSEQSRETAASEQQQQHCLRAPSGDGKLTVKRGGQEAGKPAGRRQGGGVASGARQRRGRKPRQAACGGTQPEQRQHAEAAQAVTADHNLQASAARDLRASYHAGAAGDNNNYGTKSQELWRAPADWLLGPVAAATAGPAVSYGRAREAATNYHGPHNNSLYPPVNSSQPPPPHATYTHTHGNYHHHRLHPQHPFGGGPEITSSSSASSCAGLGLDSSSLYAVYDSAAHHHHHQRPIINHETACEPTADPLQRHRYAVWCHQRQAISLDQHQAPEQVDKQILSLAAKVVDREQVAERPSDKRARFSSQSMPADSTSAGATSVTAPSPAPSSTLKSLDLSGTSSSSRASDKSSPTTTSGGSTTGSMVATSGSAATQTSMPPDESARGRYPADAQQQVNNYLAPGVAAYHSSFLVQQQRQRFEQTPDESRTKLRAANNERANAGSGSSSAVVRGDYLANNNLHDGGGGGGGGNHHDDARHRQMQQQQQHSHLAHNHGELLFHSSPASAYYEQLYQPPASHHQVVVVAERQSQSQRQQFSGNQLVDPQQQPQTSHLSDCAQQLHGQVHQSGAFLGSRA